MDEENGDSATPERKTHEENGDSATPERKTPLLHWEPAFALVLVSVAAKGREIIEHEQVYSA